MSRLFIKGTIGINCLFITSCAFQFELTSQRTALENQILGAYDELDDDLVMVSSVRSLDKHGKKKDRQKEISDLQKKAIKARQNQQFNLDDIDELKDEQILGETYKGRVVILPKKYGFVEKATQLQIKLAKLLVFEENRDRQIIWQRVIQQSPDLSQQNMPDVKKEFVKRKRKNASPGHWIQEDDEKWKQKSEKDEK